MLLGNCKEMECEFFRWSGDSYFDEETECICLACRKMVIRKNSEKDAILCPFCDRSNGSEVNLWNANT